jgi:hypothetical protein
MLVLAGAAGGAWQSTGAGAAAVGSKTMPSGRVSGHDVTVSWSASTFAGGGAVAGYVVRRYDTLGAAQTVGASCSGVVSGTSCTESGVPTGTWTYTVTPAQGNWRGAESPQSASVIVLI